LLFAEIFQNRRKNKREPQIAGEILADPNSALSVLEGGSGSFRIDASSEPFYLRLRRPFDIVHLTNAAKLMLAARF
jgi:hypothetical protein